MKKWIGISLAIVAVMLLLAFTTTNLGTHISNFTEVYADKALHQEALEIANTHKKVQNRFGTIHLKDNLSLLNGDVHYNDDRTKVKITFKFMGSKDNGVMDIEAHRVEELWEYDQIILRSRDTPDLIL